MGIGAFSVSWWLLMEMLDCGMSAGPHTEKVDLE